ncbi:hypothetical protein KQR54_33210 [Mycobacterium gordonae]|uniref:hypothetical protein n=1 Tax=Mycobacterium gordonae TaxID=1778 RepID=UPI00210E9610|nr:hypothetical protein [Mycobacterium gordonae]MCQ4365870.1 hypothetical protein [Mycobacterium gordonae]
MSDTDETEAIETEQEPDDSADKFPRAYVEKLRTEAKDNRHRAETAESRSDELTRQLFTLRVQATGKLADPTDLEFDADLLTDDDTLNAAIDDLISRKPHLKARKIGGSVGQGVTGNKEEPFSLLGRLRQSV